MNLSFRVNAQYAGIIDNTRLRTQGATVSGSTGLLFPLTRRLDLVGEVFYSPLAVDRPQYRSDNIEGLFNVRALVAYRFF
jgi:hypothetical protein